jgi:hypothetical protein
MSSDDEDSCCFVVAKNLVTSKLKTLRSSEIWNVNPFFQYWRWNPEEGFKPKHEYGRIEGKKMIYHWIVAIKGEISAPIILWSIGYVVRSCFTQFL